MAKQERHLIGIGDGSAAYWQYRHNPAEYESKQPYQQINQGTDDTWIILLGIIGTMGFLALLVKTTL